MIKGLFVFKKTVIFIGSIILISSCTTVSFEDKAELGKVALADGLIREAIDHYSEALLLKPDDNQSKIGLGLALFKAGAYEDCISNLKNAFLENNYEALFVLGESYRIQGDYKKALLYHKRAFVADTTQYKSLRSIAWIYLKLRNYSLAELNAYKATKIGYNDDETFIVLIRVLLEIGKFKAAQEVLSQRKWHSKHIPILLTLKGQLYLSLNKYKSAEKYFRKALSLYPFLVTALSGLSRCLEQNGQTAEVKTLQERARRLGYSLDSDHQSKSTYEILDAQGY